MDFVGDRSVEVVERKVVTSTEPVHFERVEIWQRHTQDIWLKINSIPRPHVRRHRKPKRGSWIFGKRGSRTCWPGIHKSGFEHGVIQRFEQGVIVFQML